MTTSLPYADLARSVLIFTHLLSLLAAFVAIAFGDFAIFRNSSVNRPMLLKSANAVKWALIALWFTGLAVIALDVSAQGPSVLQGPKLLAKLTVVVALTVNGWLLHHLTLDRIGLPTSRAEQEARVAAMLGGISVASWVCALFLGVAKPWGPVLGYVGFVAVYLAAVGAAVAVSLKVVVPRLRQTNEPLAEVSVNTEIRLALSSVIGPIAKFFIENNVGLSNDEIDAAPSDAVQRIASAVGQDNTFQVRGPGMTRHLFEQAAAAALHRRGLRYQSYAL